MGSRVKVTPGFCFLGALCLLVLPLRWGMGALLAAMVHETAHCLAVHLCGGSILSMSLGGNGAKIEAAPMSPGKSALCALAGPLGSFLVLLIAEHFPEVAVCGLIQGIYNLLPIYPLDGGRILRNLLPQAVCTGAEMFALTLCSGFSLWVGAENRELGLVLLLFLWIPVIQRKISCKAPKLAIQ